MKASLWAALLAPILGPLLWWALKAPGRAAYRAIWRYMPEGWLRRALLRRVQ